MLRTLRLAYHHQVPVLGVNLGKLGFLAEIDVPDLDDALCSIAEERFEVEPRVAVEAVVGDTVRIAFNDIALVRIPGRGQAAVGLVIDGQPFVRYVADAVIVSTPTGSTAYSFSAAEGLLVVPVAPHSAFNRALMLACSESLALELLPSSGSLALEVDGELVRALEPGQRVDLLTHVAAGSVVRLGATTFYQRAQRKLRLIAVRRDQRCTWRSGGRPRSGRSDAMASCGHLDQIRDVRPSTTEGCTDCLRTGGRWVHLRECLSCGHVGCCDSSPNRHASAHFRVEGHPLIRSFEPGEDWRWCFVDLMIV